MSKGPLAGCTDAKLLVGPFDVVDHVLKRVPARIRPNGEGGNLHADLRDRLEGSVIEIQPAAVVGGADGVRVPNDAVAIWRRAMDVLVSNGATASGPAYGHHRLGQVLGHEIRQELPDRLGRAPEQNGHLDRLFRKFVSFRRRQSCNDGES